MLKRLLTLEDKIIKTKKNTMIEIAFKGKFSWCDG